MHILIEAPAKALSSPLARKEQLAIGRVIRDRLYRSVYQPIVNLSDRCIEGFECLTRFECSAHKTPDLWFLEAEQVGLSHQLEADTLRHALRALAVLPADLYLSVNASAEAIREGGVLRIFETIDPARVILELTEHFPIQDYAGLNATLEPLRRAGLRLAVDDVGTGYADLQHLVQLRPDVVKIDMSLTSRILECLASRAMMNGLVTFAHAIGGKVVAEGIETSAQFHAVKALGVDAGQGFFLGKPIGVGIQNA